MAGLVGDRVRENLPLSAESTQMIRGERRSCTQATSLRITAIALAVLTVISVIFGLLIYGGVVPLVLSPTVPFMIGAFFLVGAVATGALRCQQKERLPRVLYKGKDNGLDLVPNSQWSADEKRPPRIDITAIKKERQRKNSVVLFSPSPTEGYVSLAAATPSAEAKASLV